MNTNSVRAVRRVRTGEPYIAHVNDSAWARRPAPEDGYVVELADGCAFVPDRLLREAGRARKREAARYLRARRP